MKIVFTGGGTAGHINPIIAIIREIKKSKFGKDIKLFYLGPKDNFAFDLFKKEGVKVKKIMAGKLRRYFSFMNFIDIFFKIPLGIIQSFFRLFIISPDLIFSKGGYGSLPVVFAGKALVIPIFLHESDISSGLSNKIASRFASEIFISFPFEKDISFPKEKVISVGNPIREEILKGNKEEAKKIFGLSGEKKVILAMGGSQGARKINDTLLAILPEFLENFELIHQTGKKNFNQVKAEAEAVIKPELKKYYHPFNFLEENQLAQAYVVADLVISRAGSGTIFELAAVGKPSILIPLIDSAQEHQIKNAYFYEKTGAAVVIEEANFTPHFFLETVKHLLESPAKIEKMIEKAKEFAKPKAAKIIAGYITAFLSQ